MAISRYSGDSRINLGQQLGTYKSVRSVRAAIGRGLVQITGQIITNGNDRLDTIAGSVYGDGRYWWVLAAASDIGWGLQVPPNTVIKIPNLEDVLRLV